MAPTCGMGCNSGCNGHSQKEEIVNLPSDAYLDPAIELEAEKLVESVEPEVIDLSLNLGLTKDDATSIESDILLPAFETALADLLKERPELEGLMPEIPTNLQSAIDQVLSKMNGSSAT